MKSSAQIEGVAAALGEGPPGFTDCFGAFDDEFDFVCRALRRQGVRSADAEDIAQDVLVVALRRWGHFDRARPLRPWLTGIAARVARDFLRRQRREVPHGQVDVPDPGLVGEDRIDAERARGRVLAALALLPDRHRIAIVLHDLQGLVPHEIAQLMGVPIATAYTRLRRAHLAFSRALTRVRKGETSLTRGPMPRLGRGLAVPFGAAPRAPLPL